MNMWALSSSKRNIHIVIIQFPYYIGLSALFNDTVTTFSFIHKKIKNLLGE